MPGAKRTTTRHLHKYKLPEIIKQGRFWEVDDVTLLWSVCDTFPAELHRLKSVKAIEEGTPQNGNGVGGRSNPATPSKILYGKDFDEINRTLVGVWALRWIYNGEYDRFTTSQPEGVKLRWESFVWLHQLFRRGLRNDSDIFPLVLLMVINDLGKDPNLEEGVYDAIGASVPGMNHDLILFEAVQRGMVPCIDLLTSEQQAEVQRGLELGSELNAGQLAQAENLPINLEGLIQMRGHRHAFDLRFMEQILDVAAAGGHKDATCAKRLIEPVFQSFHVVHEVALEIIEGRATLREGYDMVLTKRGNMLHVDKRWDRKLSVRIDGDRALLRLLTMGRTADVDQAELFYSAFHNLQPEDKQRLVQGLNVDGNDGERAVIPYYMPAVLSALLEIIKHKPRSSQEKALQSVMRYLGRVLYEKRHDTPLLNDNIELPYISTSGTVIERNLTKALEVIKGADFRNDSSVLDDLKVPRGHFVQRRSTLHLLSNLGQA